MSSIRNGLAVSVLAGLLSVWLSVPVWAATLTYGGSTFTEGWLNDGSIGTVVTLTLTNDAFTGANGDVFGTNKVAASNVPTGLTAVVTRLATNQAQVALAGNAAQHATANSISNLCLAFLDSAFAGGAAAAVTNSVRTNLAVAFLSQNSSNWYVNGSSGSDATGNGSSGNPWATLSNAVAKAQSSANDAIHLVAGTYTASNLAVSKVVSILGNSRDDTFIQPPATNAGVLAPTVSCKLGNLTLRNGRRNMGGAVYLGTSGIDLYVASCRLLNNTATNGSGGAIYSGYNGGVSVVSLADTEAAGNQASANGGAVYIYAHGLTVSNCVLACNTASNGGAIHVGAGGPSIKVVDTLAISNSATSGSGGALWASYNRLFGVQRSVFAFNTAGVDGGALYLYIQSAAGFTNATFYGNACGLGGGGQGGAIWYLNNSAGSLSAYNSTFFLNSAPTGGAFRSFGTVRLYSSIVASNTASSGVGPEIYMASGSTVATNSLIGNKGANAGTDASMALGQPNAAGCYVGTNGAALNAGLLPLAYNGGALPTCALRASSPAVDHGVNLAGLSWDGRGTGFARVAGPQCDMGAFELATLAYGGTTFYESAANDGSLSNRLLVTLSGTTFNASNGVDLVAAGKVVPGNVPTGLTAVVTLSSATQAVVVLTGNAVQNTVSDSVTNMSLVFLDSAFANGYAGTISGSSNASLGVSFFGAAVARALSYGGSNFTESAANDGTIGNAIVVTLAGDTLVGTMGENLAGTGKLTAGNVPAGLTVVATLSNANQVVLTLAGAAAAQNAANGITNLALAFQDGAFFGGNAAGVTGATRSNLQITFSNPALTYGGDTFSEAAANDGSIANVLSITLAGDTFNATNGENLTASGKVVPGNVPAGLTAVVTCVAGQQVAVSLAGKATLHNATNSVASLSLAFADAAFTHGSSSSVTNAARSNLKVNFVDPALTYSGTAFSEGGYHPGVILNTLSVTLAGDTFNAANGENLLASGKVTMNNVPAGLTAVVTVSSPTQAVVSLIGIAVSNEAANSIGNLTVQFQNAAFSGNNAAVVAISTVTNLGVAFVSPLDWYVAPNGSDTTGDGSSNNPYATVAKAVSVAQSLANDVIHLQPGTYTQNGIAVGKIVTIAGHSFTDTILQAAATAFTTNKNILNFSNSGIVRNLTLRHGNPNGSGGAVGLSGAYDFCFDTCLFASNAASASGQSGGAVQAGGNSGAATILFLNCQFVGNRSASDGGGVYAYSPSLLVSNCVFSANTAGRNGGAVIRNDTTRGKLTVRDSVLMNNVAANAGGAVYGANNTACAIWNSTVAGNQAGLQGGGLFSSANDGGVTTNLVCNSTFYGNASGGVGGGLYHWSNAGCPLSVYNSTIFANAAATNGGGIYVDYNQHYDLVSSIVAGNTASNGPDVFDGGSAGTVTNSLLGDNTAAGSGLTAGTPNAAGSYVGTTGAPVDPGLLPLAFNGGALPTCALARDSVARNRGSNPLGLTWDQRGSPHLRVRYSIPDMGAFEYGPKGPVFGAQ